MNAHLHNYSRYSVGLGLSAPFDMAQAVGEGGALALTDRNNIAGAVAHKKACRRVGVKPIWGVDLDVAGLGAVVLLAQDDRGWSTMLDLLGTGATVEALLSNPEGLYCLTGHTEGPLWRAYATGDNAVAKKLISPLVDAFGDRLIFESSNRGIPEHEKFERFASRAARFFGARHAKVKIARYAREDQKVYHASLAADHFKARVHDPWQLVSRWPDGHIVSDWADPVSMEVAQDCHFDLDISVSPILPQPNAPVGMEHMTPEEMLWEIGQRGLARHNVPLAKMSKYDERFRHEYDIICSKGFAGYFLIVADYVSFARESGLLVGPGRGSGVGSLVAWSLGITQLDPIEHGLFFERFLNPERMSMPDFDVDFPRSGRRAVIEYVQGTYGKDSVMMCATYGEMKARSAFASAARVVGVMPQDAIQFAKRFIDDNKPPGSREFANTGAEEHIDERVDRALRLAGGLAGAYHSVGQHAGGVFITPGKGRLLAPATEDGVCQLDHYDAESLGLIKFDFLGLKELDVLMYVSEMTGVDIDFETLDVEDPAIYEVISNGDTLGVFQMGGWGFSSVLTRMKPSCFDDIVAAVALYRPGPKDAGMIDQWISRRHGRSEVVYPHDDLESILAETYGVIVYQEQVMQIVQKMGGFTLGRADVMRRGMGKKIASVIEELKGEFMSGASELGYAEDDAAGVWDQMATFANYGFNKSHAAAYALISAATAWAKAHYRAESIAASLRARVDDSGDRDNVPRYVEEAKEHGIEVVNFDPADPVPHTTVRDGKIMLGFTFVAGVSAEDLPRLELGRGAEDILTWVDKVSPNSSTISALARAGCFDGMLPEKLPAVIARTMHEMSIKPSASRVFETLLWRMCIERNANSIAKSARDARGQLNLFGVNEIAWEPSSCIPSRFEPESKEDIWRRCARMEYAAFGYALRVHEATLERMKRRGFVDLGGPFRDFEESPVCGIVRSYRKITTSKGSEMAFARIEDETGGQDIAIFEDDLESFGAFEGDLVKINLWVDLDIDDRRRFQYRSRG